MLSNGYANTWIPAFWKLIVLVLIVCFFVKIICPVRNNFTYIFFILKRGIVYRLSMCIHNHPTSIKFFSSVRVERNTRCILVWYLTRVSFTLFDLCMETLSRTRNIRIILSSYFWSTLYKIKELFSSLLSVTICVHIWSLV